MKYLLNERFRLRGWKKRPTGLLFVPSGGVRFFPKELYRLLMYCDGAHELDPDSLGEKERSFLEGMEKDGVIRRAQFGEYLSQEQSYRMYPAEYRAECHWSVTGCCNLRCRHCFMSAPQAKHGSPSFEQLLNIADQLAGCGVPKTAITGGEPLIRGDFLPLMDELKKREITLTTIFTNGWLVDEALLDALEERKMRPSFQLSFDGVGQHDFLRGVEGAEERTAAALKLLCGRGYSVSVSMCLHGGNIGTIRDTVNFLASLGVRSLKIGPMMELGQWAQPEMRALYISEDEANEAFCEYIPRFFEDGAPIDIMLGGGFMFSKRENTWSIYHVCPVSAADEGRVPSCGVLTRNFFVSAEGRVAPCMGMDDCAYAVNFPSLFEKPLSQILTDPSFTHLECTTVKEIRDANPKCRSCAHVDKCSGGCRNAALLEGDDYLGVPSELCRFFDGGWDRKITEAAEPAYKAYLKRQEV